MTNPFGIYVHIPFCVHKCSYCDFYSFTKYQAKDFDSHVARVEDELVESARNFAAQGRTPAPAVSVFFGGGTPSLLPTRLLARLTSTLVRCFPLAADAEITLEANPETVSEEFCAGLVAETPFNRVSLGAQSFDAANLKALERLSSAESVRTATRRLTAAGMTNYSLDLIFGIPGQGRGGLLSDIAEAAKLRPNHISFYNLTLKPAHPLYRQLPTDDEAADLYEAGRERLEAEGYRQYEISNFSRPGFESRHNRLYWAGGDFLGVGPSAASRFFWDGVFHHRKQLSDFAAYLGRRAPDPAFEATTSAQTILEAAFLELRVNEGVRAREFAERYRYDLRRAKKYPLFVREGLIEEAGEYLRLTDKGRLLADSVTRDLVD